MLTFSRGPPPLFTAHEAEVDRGRAGGKEGGPRRIVLRSHAHTYWVKSAKNRVALPLVYLLGGEPRPVPEANQSGWHTQTPLPQGIQNPVGSRGSFLQSGK